MKRQELYTHNPEAHEKNLSRQEDLRAAIGDHTMTQKKFMNALVQTTEAEDLNSEE